jgi:hypothetical protein
MARTQTQMDANTRSCGKHIKAALARSGRSECGGIDYGVLCGEWCIGRIYETRTGPESLRLVLGATCSQQAESYAPTTAQRRWMRLRRSSRRAGGSARRGRGWKRCHKFRLSRTVYTFSVASADRASSARSASITSPNATGLPPSFNGATYLLLTERYMGLNNGTIPYSVREVAAELHISQPTACRCLEISNSAASSSPGQRGHSASRSATRPNGG